MIRLGFLATCVLAAAPLQAHPTFADGAGGRAWLIASALTVCIAITMWFFARR